MSNILFYNSIFVKLYELWFMSNLQIYWNMKNKKYLSVLLFTSLLVACGNGTSIISENDMNTENQVDQENDQIVSDLSSDRKSVV